MASMIIVKLIGAVFKIPLANLLHETGMAYFSTAYTLFTTIYALTVTGLSAAVARMVAETSTCGRYRDVKKLLRISTTIFVIVGVLGSLIILVSAKGLSDFSKNPDAFWSIIMVSPAIFFCCLMASYRGYYEGLSDMIPTAITQVVEVVIKLIAGLMFASLVIGIAQKQFAETQTVFGTPVANADGVITVALPFASAGAILGVSVSTIIGFLYIFIRYKMRGDSITKKQVIDSPKPMRTKVLLFRLIKIAIPITLGAVVLQLSALIDSLTIANRLEYCYKIDPVRFDNLYGNLLKPDELMNVFLFGCFSTVITIFNLVPAFTNIFGKSALPNVTTAWTTKDKKNIKINIESVIRVTMLVAAPAGIGISFMAEPIIRLLFGNSQGTIVAGSPLLTGLGIGAMFLALVTPLNAIMQGIGRMDLPVKYLFTGAMIKLVLNIVLIGIPSINIMGAAISTVCCYGTIAVLSIVKLKKIANVHLNFTGILIKPIISGFICGFSAFLFNKALTFISNSSIITILSIFIGAIFYVISLSLLNAISRDDVLMLPKGNKILKTLEKFRIIR